ncbi:MAG: 4-(cytidine 5'-diphospho)-2-C-methyl-D-erythritol kinase [Gammaproteobacteria bacterium]|nr:4-(cytidine 5'-diphospho)-2-C-methyl-D-erythritol kinase [Gammaproteobacteria bacterium]
MSHAPWPAPAKLNLFLHITGRRADGYHLLQSVFQFLDFGDEIDIDLRDDGAIHRLNDLPGVAPEQDLVVRAARLLQQRSGCQLGADIRVEKRLPLGGGLGGGSSDAATVLVALNRLWGVHLPLGELAELGLQLGADVPVFVHGHAAWAEGVGEILQPVELPEPWYLVIIPPVEVSTARIFSDPQLTRECQAIKIRAFLAGEGENVCQPVAARHYPEIAQALAWLGHFATARMTGTGSCVFAAFDTREGAETVYRQLPAGWRGFVAKGSNRSALHSRLAEF